MIFWDMTIGEDLNKSIHELPSTLQRSYFECILQRYNKYVKETDDIVTFGEYYNMFEREPPKSHSE